MSRIGLAPVVGLVLAIAACGGILLFQERVSSSSNAQLTLARTENSLNQLQGLPWEVENPRFGSPARIRVLMDRTQRSILASVDRLRQTAPATELEPLADPLRANFGSLGRIYTMGLKPGGWNNPGPTIAVSQAENVSLAKAESAIDAAGSVYARRVVVAKWMALIGGIGTIVGLLAAFLFYYRRSRRVARVQLLTLEAKEAAHERLAQTLATLSHSQEERDRLLERTVEVAEHERIRLAMDLHDGPIQQLTVLAFNIDRLAGRLDRDELGGARTLMADVRHSLSTEMEGLRQMMVELRPPILDEGGLSAALNDAAEKVLADTPIEWGVRCEIEKNQLAPALETAVYRVAYEALVNVRKHSQATRVDVLVAPDGGVLRLVIADNGRGFDMTALDGPSNGERYGLLGIQERVGGLSGTCRIESRPGSGTRIEAVLPLKVRNVEEVDTRELAVA